MSDYLAAIRTLFAIIRTGGAIAGGGTIMTTVLGKDWPHWVEMVVTSSFVILGYGIIWAALIKGRELRRRYQSKELEEVFFPIKGVIIVTVTLQVLLLVVVVLHLFGLYRGGVS